MKKQAKSHVSSTRRVSAVVCRCGTHFRLGLEPRMGIEAYHNIRNRAKAVNGLCFWFILILTPREYQCTAEMGEIVVPAGLELQGKAQLWKMRMIDLS